MGHVLFCNMSSVCLHMVTVIMFSMTFFISIAVFNQAKMHESLSFWTHFDAFVPFSSQMQLYSIYSCRDNCHAALKMLKKKKKKAAPFIIILKHMPPSSCSTQALIQQSSFFITAQRNFASVNSLTEPAWKMEHVCSCRGLVTWHPTAPRSPTLWDCCELFISLWIEIALCYLDR